MDRLRCGGVGATDRDSATVTEDGRS